jgi:hypothetical protein
LQADFFTEAALRWLGWYFEAVAVNVEFPAMIRAANSRFLVAAEPERNAPVSTELFYQAKPAVAVAESDETLG